MDLLQLDASFFFCLAVWCWIPVNHTNVEPGKA